MNNYYYRQFDVLYETKLNDNKLYTAHGYAVCLINERKPSLAHEFSTDAPTQEDAENQIKKLINDYIDFEWQQAI